LGHQKGGFTVNIRSNFTIASVVLVALVLVPLIGVSQEKKTNESGWLKYGSPIPDPKGPAPKLANGKPSMAGLWSQTRRADITDKRLPGFVAELPYTAWGKRQWDNYDVVKHGDYAGSCMPFGWSRTMYGPHPIQIMQDDEKLVVMAEQNTWFSLVYVDGRPHDKELPSTWYGDTVGKWDGDTLVLETVNLNGYTKLDTIGHPISSKATFTQTFKRTNFGTIEHTFTVNDPKTYTRPFTITDTWPLEPVNTKLLEYSCMENNLETLMTGAITPWKAPEGEDAP